MSSGVRRRKEIQVPFALNCAAVHHLYQNATNNGRTGHMLTSANNSKRLATMYNSSKGMKRIRQGIARLGSGKQGVVFLACTSPKCKQQLIIKVAPFDRQFPQNNQPAEYEFKVHRQVFKVAPTHVSAMYSFKLCRDFTPVNSFRNRSNVYFDYSHQMVTFGEYCNGGDFDTWLDKLYNRLTDQDMAQMIFQILSTLKRIRSKYPDFRHNDLHLGNIMVDDTGNFPRLVIVDFGISNLSIQSPNPLLTAGVYSGLSVRMNPKYDPHFFLNSLRIHVKTWSKLPETNKFLDFAVPPGYRGNSDTHINDSRLIPGTDTSRLPSLDDLLKNPFMNMNSSAPRTVSSPRNVIRRYSPTSPNVPNAAEIARNLLAGNTGLSVSVMSERPSAANFLKLSPTSRAALKKNGPRKPSVLKFNTKARVTTAPVFSIGMIRRNFMKNRPVSSGSSGPTRVLIPSRVNTGILLRYFMNTVPNASKLNLNNLTNHLVNRGYSPRSAQRAAEPWFNTWKSTRSNANLATRALKAGRNIKKNGFKSSARKTAQRRVTLNLSKSPGGRIRGKKALLVSKKKDELVQMARNAGIPHSNKTKQQLVNALYG